MGGLSDRQDDNIRVDFQDAYLRVNPGNLKEGKNEAVPGEPGKMEYIQP
jgi:hypothetical protein